MRNTHDRNPILKLAAPACLALATASVQAAEPLALQKIMQDLGSNMQLITDGISRGDWERVGKAASSVADHPRPPLSEKMRIIGFVGSDMGKFKALDGETHDQAQAVARAARVKDGPGVILAFQKLQTSCYNCHSEFRKPFVEHFYGAR